MQRKYLFVSIGLALSFFLSSSMVAAEEELGDLDTGSEMDHFEFTMGFVAGARRYDGLSFGLDGGGKGIDGEGSLTEPFSNAPFDYVSVYGLRYDFRLVVSMVRMTVGMDFPFASFRNGDTRGVYDVGGVEREVVVRELRPYELRFGIGAEHSFGRVTPFVDLIGEVDWVNAELSLDGVSTSYDSTSFGFSIRAGARLYLREWFFISAAGDIGLVGGRFWDAQLSLGFSFG